jgi:LuxR family transcriptional regulator, quorum-sensing system regulator BjaR1
MCLIVYTQFRLAKIRQRLDQFFGRPAPAGHRGRGTQWRARRAASTKEIHRKLVKLEEIIASIEASATVADLRDVLHDVATRHGFSGFNFLDIGDPTDSRPFYLGTSGKAWEKDYVSSNFLGVDPCLRAARVSNIPFRWDEIKLHGYRTGKKSGAMRTMEAALDHGFTNGLVIPHRFVDPSGKAYSAVVTFFWQEAPSMLKPRLDECQTDIYIIVVYWLDKLVSLQQQARRPQTPLLKASKEHPLPTALTDREQDILSWAARGKTNSETAKILGITEQTVEFHLRNASRKLNALNKTHAVALALMARLINI